MGSGKITNYKTIVFTLFISCFIIFVLTNLINAKKGASVSEVSESDAIDVAITEARLINYNLDGSDIEIIKVKQGIERGVFRLSWLVRFFPRKYFNLILENDYWVIYFYPKGLVDDPRSLGNEFCVLVDLYSGNVIASHKVP